MSPTSGPAGFGQPWATRPPAEGLLSDASLAEAIRAGKLVSGAPEAESQPARPAPCALRPAPCGRLAHW
eukprot:2801543-Prymnesium_polylepis.1